MNKLSEESLLSIPGVGRSIAGDLQNIGIKSVSDLKGKSPETLYAMSNKRAGTVPLRCVFR
jgi:predicted RecB family nuclease